MFIKRAVLAFAILTFVFINPCFANQKSQAIYNKSLKYVEKEQYTKAIYELNRAHSIDPYDYKVLGTLSRQYFNRGKKYTEQGEWGKAAIDFRSSLYYIYVYKNPEDMTKGGLFDDITSNIQACLKYCYKKLKYKDSRKNRLMTAKLLEMTGNYPAAGYEYLLIYFTGKYPPEVAERLDFIKTETKCEKKEEK